MTDQSDAGQSVQPPTNQKAVNRGRRGNEANGYRPPNLAWHFLNGEGTEESNNHSELPN